MLQAKELISVYSFLPVPCSVLCVFLWTLWHLEAFGSSLNSAHEVIQPWETVILIAAAHQGLTLSVLYEEECHHCFVQFLAMTMSSSDDPCKLGKYTQQWKVKQMLLIYYTPCKESQQWLIPSCVGNILSIGSLTFSPFRIWQPLLSQGDQVGAGWDVLWERMGFTVGFSPSFAVNHVVFFRHNQEGCQATLCREYTASCNFFLDNLLQSFD